ncbi:MAG: LysM peptidoglycan-binding domain-containing protein [Phycisphaeraceae bacterium]|nr:LysM peptidoglycan-binding domain-containing protein [Phycisphaeraceae bacterium]
MTRETKVGLLVGLGVILLIGIIVSDQLSQIQKQQPADLTDFADAAQQGIISDELVGPALNAPPARNNTAPGSNTTAPASESVTSEPAHAGIAPTPVPNATAESDSPITQPMQVQADRSDLADRLVMQIERARQDGLAVSAERQQEEGVIRMPQRSETSDAAVPVLALGQPRLDQQATAAKPVVHTVADGDSLYRIAEKYLGDGTRWREIVNANPGKIGDDNQIQVGAKLTIPSREINRPAPAGTPDSQSPAPMTAPTRSNARKTYTVKSGDTLFSIARVQLGDGGRWKSIYDANRDKLADPDSVKVGQSLKIPG